MKKTGILILCLFGLAQLASIAAAQGAADEFVLGKHYQAVTPAQPVQAGDKIEVLEVFWYGCPHCYDFEPYIDQWQKSKPAAAEFVRMPAILNPSWIGHARAYYG